MQGRAVLEVWVNQVWTHPEWGELVITWTGWGVVEWRKDNRRHTRTEAGFEEKVKTEGWSLKSA